MKKLYDVYWTAQYSTVVEVDKTMSKKEIRELIANTAPIAYDESNDSCYVQDSFQILTIKSINQ